MRLPPARATIAIAAITALAWVAAVAAGQGDRLAVVAGFIPARMSGLLDVAGAAPVWITPLSATLVHNGLWHILLNLLIIGFCGRLVEASIGPLGIVIVYVLGAYCGAAALWGLMPSSPMPSIGASGAGSALVGAYALLYNRRRGAGWGPFSGDVLQVLWLAVAWTGLLLLYDLATVGSLVSPASVAPSHIGGFLVGLALARPLLLFRYRDA
jgi:membrane associated rhomboid family serine protease